MGRFRCVTLAEADAGWLLLQEDRPGGLCVSARSDRGRWILLTRKGLPGGLVYWTYIKTRALPFHVAFCMNMVKEALVHARHRAKSAGPS